MIIENQICTIEHFDEIKFSPTKVFVTKLLNPESPFNSFQIVPNDSLYDRLKKYKENNKLTRLKAFDVNGDIYAMRQIVEFRLFDIDVSHVFKNLYEIDEVPKLPLYESVQKTKEKIFVLPGKFVKSKKKYLLPHEIELYLSELIIDNAFKN